MTLYMHVGLLDTLEYSRPLHMIPEVHQGAIMHHAPQDIEPEQH